MRTFVIYIVLFSILIPFHMSFGNMTSNEFTMEIKPQHDNFVEGEPLQFVLTFTNSSSDVKRVNLGSEGVGNLRLILRRNGVMNECFAPKRGGLTRNVVFEVKPECAEERMLFIKDFITLTNHGSYYMTVDLVNSSIKPATTEFHIIPNTESNRKLLELHYSEITNKLSEASTAQIREDARRALLLSRHQLALQAQMDILDSGDWLDHRECEELVDAMISFRSEKSIRCLVTNLLSDPKVSSIDKSIVLRRLRHAHVESWKGAPYEVLIPYLEEIQHANLTAISD